MYPYPDIHNRKFIVVQRQIASLGKCQLTTEFAINKSKALTILHVCKQVSYLLTCFVHANKSFIKSTSRRIYG